MRMRGSVWEGTDDVIFDEDLTDGKRRMDPCSCFSMHLPNQILPLNDVNNVAPLIAEACRTVSSGTDFKVR